MKIYKETIQQYLIHQPPFLFVDEAEIIDDYTIKSTFNLEPNTEILKGHFPNFPILPAVISIEIMAQTGLLLNAIRTNLTRENYMTYFVKLESFNFKDFIFPPAKIETKVKVKPSETFENYFEASGSMFVGQKRKCYGDMLVYFKKKEHENERYF